MILADADYAAKHDLPVLAKISAMAQHAQEPEWFSTAPAFAIQKTLAKAGLSARDVDLYEVNEAFAAVSLACNRLAELPEERVNVNGGAVSLGHPIGASGARILVTLFCNGVSGSVSRIGEPVYWRRRSCRSPRGKIRSRHEND